MTCTDAQMTATLLGLLLLGVLVLATVHAAVSRRASARDARYRTAVEAGDWDEVHRLMGVDNDD